MHFKRHSYINVGVHNLIQPNSTLNAEGTTCTLPFPANKLKLYEMLAHLLELLAETSL